MLKFILVGNVEQFGTGVDKSRKTVNMAHFKMFLAILGAYLGSRAPIDPPNDPKIPVVSLS